MKPLLTYLWCTVAHVEHHVWEGGRRECAKCYRRKYFDKETNTWLSPRPIENPYENEPVLHQMGSWIFTKSTVRYDPTDDWPEILEEK